MKTMVFILLLTAAFAGGCKMLPSGFNKDLTPGHTAYETDMRTYRTLELQRQMIWDDWDHFWLLDKPSRLNYLRVR